MKSGSFNYQPKTINVWHVPVVSEAYHDWSGEAAGARLRVNFTLKLLLSQNFCNRPLMRFISFASNIGPAAAVPAGPAPTPLCTIVIYRPVLSLRPLMYGMCIGGNYHTLV